MGQRLNSILAVKKRFGDEWTDVRDFCRPKDVMVLDVLATRPRWTIEEIWDWVLANIRYPSAPEPDVDFVALVWPRGDSAYGFMNPKRRYYADDFWEFPAETLRDREADCEGSAALFVSMVRAAFPNLSAYVSVGWFKDKGHVWGSIRDGDDWLVIDTTLNTRPSVTPREANSPYEAIFRYNEVDVIWEGPATDLPPTHPLGKDEEIQSWYALFASGRVGVWQPGIR